MDEHGTAPAALNTGVAHPARVYDYLLGGKDNFAVDRAAAEAGIAAAPEVRDIARANRAFLVRAVRFVAADLGVRQFLDIGTGIPTSPNVHEVAQAVDPSARVVYVDNDPIVAAHARALMAGPGQGVTGVVQADLRDPESVLAHKGVTGVLDLARPVAVLLIAVLHHLTDADDPAGVVARFLAPLAPGSALVFAHLGRDLRPDASGAVAGAANRSAVTLVPRDRAQIEEILAGIDLVDPGLVRLPRWRPVVDPGPELDRVWAYAAVGVKR